MIRETIDYGIDLGTTNSAIAVLRGVTAEVIKNNQDADITPSVVGMDKRGALRVGRTAKDMIGSDTGNAHAEFKRQMGTTYEYLFQRSGRRMRPEALSAEVLKDLRGSVQQRTGELIDGAVITVPAAFELHQCDATQKAAVLAGFAASPLLQEPVAAALAYGFQVESERSYWLVYDFGGGTFDAAVIKSEDGTIRVVNHGGDNFLGGSDIDWAIIDNLVVPALIRRFELVDFQRGSPRWQLAFALIKRSVEQAKIALSRSESVWLDECRFPGPDGETIEPDIELTKAHVIAAARPFIERSIEICRSVLKEKRLSPKAVEKMILVGGPTLAPYVREHLSAALGIPLEHSVDPLTVVARGAAVFAGTQRRAASLSTVRKGAFAIELTHKPVGVDTDPLIGGRIVAPNREALDGFTIEFVEADSAWRSGQLPVSQDGVFTATLHAERGRRNTYAIALSDGSGTRQDVSPQSLNYTVGSAVDEQPLIHSMGLPLADNAFDCLLERGRGLPAKMTRTFHSAVPLKRGQAGDVLRIPVCEGESQKGDRNRWVGELLISSTQISRDLPAHSEIEVTLELNASRLLTVRAYVPMLDSDFETTLAMHTQARKYEDVRGDVEGVFRRIDEALESARGLGDVSAGQSLSSLRESPLAEEIRSLSAAAADEAAAVKCESRLLELKREIDSITDRMEWPIVQAELRELRQMLEAEAPNIVDGDLKKGTQAAIAELGHVAESGEIADARIKIQRYQGIYWQIQFGKPEFWVQQFQRLTERTGAATDRARAEKLCDQGRAFISQNNVDGLRNVVTEIWKLMPSDPGAPSALGYQSGLLRGMG